MKHSKPNDAVKSIKCQLSNLKYNVKVSKVNLMSASRVNHLAVALLQANLSDFALTCIKTGLRHVIRSRLISKTTKQRSYHITSHVLPAIKINEDQIVSPEGAFVFYNHAFILCSTISDEEVLSLLLYNLGFIYHRQAIERGCTPRLLRAALKMYSQAQKLGGPDLLLFAIMNNMGHALSCLFEHESVRTYQHHFALYRHRYRKLVPTEDYCILHSKLVCAPMA